MGLCRYLFFISYTNSIDSCFVVQSLGRVRLFVTPWTAAHQASLSITNSWSLLKLMSIESVMQSSHLILCCPLLLLPSIFLSIRVFSNESALCIRWPKYWSFSFSICPPSEYSGLIYFRIDWFDLLAVQGTLKSLLQHHSSKASILQHSAFFMVQLWKNRSLTKWTFVRKVMSLLCNTLSRFVGFPGVSVDKESACNAGDPCSISGSGRSPGEGISHPLWWSRVSQVAQIVKNLPAMQDTWVRSLGLEDPLEGGHGNPLQYS